MRFRHYFVAHARAILPTVSFAAFALACVPALAHADAAAEALLVKVTATLRDAKTISADFVVSTVHPTRYSDTQERGTVTLSRPDQARVEITRYRKPVNADHWIASGNGSTVVTDGHDLRTLIWHPNSAQYRRSIAGPLTPSRVLASLDPVDGFFGTPGPPASARSLGTRTWKNGRYSVVQESVGAIGSEGVRELYIGDDNLIHRVVSRLTVGDKPVTREVVLSNPRINPTVAPVTFAFTPPANATPIETVASRPLLPVGTEAPDFAVVDVTGKTVHLSDFRGKVVVLKFFATWCWTCKQSLLYTERLAEKNANSDLVVVAVDIWNSREAFKAWAAKTPYRTIRFLHDDHPQGKDAASVLYHVASIPTEFIVSREGNIVAHASGYEGLDADFEKAISSVVTRHVSRAQ